MSAVLCRTMSARPVCAPQGAAAPKVAFEIAPIRSLTQDEVSRLAAIEARAAALAAVADQAAPLDALRAIEAVVARA